MKWLNISSDKTIFKSFDGGSTIWIDNNIDYAGFEKFATTNKTWKCLKLLEFEE